MITNCLLITNPFYPQCCAKYGNMFIDCIKWIGYFVDIVISVTKDMKISIIIDIWRVPL